MDILKRQAGQISNEKVFEPSLPKGYYRIGLEVFNGKGESVGIWVGGWDSVKFENCSFSNENSS